MLPSKRVLEYSRCLCHEYSSSSTCNAFESTRDHAFEITTWVLVCDAFEVTRDLCLLQIASYSRYMFTTNSFLFTKHVWIIFAVMTSSGDTVAVRFVVPLANCFLIWHAFIVKTSSTPPNHFQTALGWTTYIADVPFTPATLMPCWRYGTFNAH